MSSPPKISTSSAIGPNKRHFNAPSVTFVTLESFRRFLIVFTPTSNYYCVIHIDPYHGALSFSGVFGSDMFNTEQEALDYISSNDPIKKTVKGFSLLGYTTSGNIGLLIIIKNAEAQYNLMLKHTIYKIKEVEVVRFNIIFPSKFQIDIDKLRRYPFHYNHFFCLTYDIGSPFSGKTKNIPAINAALVVSLQSLNIPNICPYVVQGTFNFSHLDEFKTDALFITRRVSVDGEIDKGIDQNCKPAIEYQVELVFISKIGNGFRIFSHLAHIGSVPLVCDSYYSLPNSSSSSSQNFNSGDSVPPQNDQQNDETNDVKFAKKMYEKVINFVPCTNIYNIFLQKEKQTQSYTKLLQRSLKVCNFTNENITCFLVKPENINFIDSEKLESSIELTIKTLLPILNDIGFSETFLSDNETEIRKRCQNGFIRMSILHSCRDELITMTILFLIAGSVCGILNQPIERYIDINRSSATFLQLLGDSILSIASSIMSFSNSKATRLKEILSAIFPPLSNIPKGPSYYEINNTFEPLNLLQPFDWICASYGPNSQILFPQNVNHSILECISRPVGFQNKLYDLTILLARNIFLKEIVLELCDTAANYPPVFATIRGGLYLNRMFPILENVALPYTKEKHLSIRIPLTPAINYDPYERVYDMEPVRFLTLQLLNPSESVSICNVTVFGTIDSDSDVLLAKKLRSKDDKKKPKQELSVKKPASLSDVIPSAINYEMIRISSDYTASEAIIKLIQAGVHPDTFDLGLLSDVKKPEDTSSKKKVCKKCQKQNQCSQCYNCHEYFCKNCFSKQTDLHVCEKCFDQINHLIESKDRMRLLIESQNIENNSFIKSHVQKLNRIKAAQPNPCHCSPDECLVCPNAWPLYELSKSIDNVPFELCLLDSDTCYKSPSNLLQTVIALDSVYDIQRIEIVCEHPLQVFINKWEPQISFTDPQEPLYFNPPSSTCFTSITAQNIDITFMSERIQIKRIKLYGSPKSREEVEEQSPDKTTRRKRNYRLPLTNDIGSISSKYNGYLQFHHCTSYTVKLSEGDPYHTYTFDGPVDIIGFHFTELYSYLKTIIFQLFPSSAQPPTIVTRVIPKYKAKEADIIFPKSIKQIKCVRVWYLRLSDTGKSLLSSPPIPLEIE